MATATLHLGRGGGITTPAQAPIGAPMSIGWTNAVFQATPTTTDPITLLLQLLI